MPEGQFTGSRSKYVYTGDGGESYILTLDDSLVVAGSGLVPYDPAAPPANSCPAPRRFTPRGVFWQGTAAGFVGKRKYLVAGTAGSALYASSTPAEITIDGVLGITTGRKGEKLTF